MSTDWVIKTIETYFLAVLEVRSLISRCKQCHSFSEVSRKEFFLLSSSFWWLQAIPWTSLLCRHITPVRASVVMFFSMYFFVSYKEHQSLNLGPTLIQYDRNFNYIYKDPISKRSHILKVLGRNEFW